MFTATICYLQNKKKKGQQIVVRREQFILEVIRVLVRPAVRSLTASYHMHPIRFRIRATFPGRFFNFLLGEMPRRVNVAGCLIGGFSRLMLED